MEIRLEGLHPNPFRDMDNYPIDQEKIESLKRSIKSTSFWDNILARKRKAGGYEIAYGHHRLIALRELFDPDHKVDIPIRDLDDSLMIRIMANENDESWGAMPVIIDETVRVTKKFLEDHPAILKALRKPDAPTSAPVGAELISRFLDGNWYKNRITYSLERLGLIEKKKISKKAVDALPTEGSARTFVAEAKKVKGVTLKQQERAAEKIGKSGDRSKAGIRGALIDEKYGTKKKKKENSFIVDLKAHLKEAVYHAKKLNTRVMTIVDLKGRIDPNIYAKELEDLWIQLKILHASLQKLNTKEKVKLLK